MLVVNSSFPELNHLAAGLAEAGLLSRYVRPYANLERSWERVIVDLPMMGQVYRRTLGRRRLPEGLGRNEICEAGLLHDIALALVQRIPLSGRWVRDISQSLVDARARAVARAGARALRDDVGVVASWGCAGPTFKKINGGLCLLNYSFAHHRFVRKLLLEEAEHQPTFAETLSSHNWLEWQQEQLDEEIELADRVLVGSSFVRESFLSEGVPSEKLEVIPYGVDTELFEPARPSVDITDRSFKLLFVGQIGQRKGIAYLLRAYEKFKGPGTNLTLVGRVEGNGGAISPYRSLFDHVDHVPCSYLPDIYRKADVFVFPTLVEGLPLVVLEAMASGLPVIVTPNGSGDIVRDGVDGFVVPIRDVGAIVDRLEQLRRDPALRVQMSQSARCRAMEFTWETYRHVAVTKIQQWLTNYQ